MKRPGGALHTRGKFLIAAIVTVCTIAAIPIASHSLPSFPSANLRDWPTSPTITDRNGRMLLTVVGRDQQWRTPVPLNRISPQLLQATIAVEDARFTQHHGVDWIAAARACSQNLIALRKVSGASTLTMQVCRMIDDRPRTLAAKIAETLRATQLENTEDKTAILEDYLNLAPYGGNIRGVEAASQHWFNKHAADLSLSEAALLAGLPQSPNRYRPDRHPAAALARRRHVLDRMCDVGYITLEESQRAAAESLALAHPPRDAIAPQAAWFALQRRPHGGQLTLDATIQNEVQQRVSEHAASLSEGTQAAALVIDIATNEVVAMVGSARANDPVAGQVNGAIARRSPGSTLKPFVYAAAFESNLLGPESTVYDVPIERDGWRPVNFDGTYAGPLTAAEALRRSLNVPAILVAERVGLPRCLGTLESAGIRLPARAQSRGGLAFVVGAAEVSLLDLVNAYATIARNGIRCEPRVFVDDPLRSFKSLDSQACAMIDDILSCRRRTPRGCMTDADSLAWFMWKTGTSSGRRDAWAVGHNHRYAIGVWMGRFSGKGSPEMVGAEVAEPLLTRLFQSPALRCDQDPPAVPSVHRPDLPRPAALDSLRITHPQNNAEILALHQTATIRASASKQIDLTWFLNGRLIARSQVENLQLSPGRYELRCTDAAGMHDEVNFSVR